jgi:hypothetical protein
LDWLKSDFYRLAEKVKEERTQQNDASPIFVIPADAGIQLPLRFMDSTVGATSAAFALQ